MENGKPKQANMKGSNANRYDEEFKTGAVRLVMEQKRPMKQVASDLGVCIDTLRGWVKASGGSPSSGDAAQNRALQAEIRALKKQVADQQETIEILKKAAAIFTRP